MPASCNVIIQHTQGGPLGELVQWTDLIVVSEIMCECVCCMFVCLCVCVCVCECCMFVCACALCLVQVCSVCTVCVYCAVVYSMCRVLACKDNQRHSWPFAM